MTLTHTLVGLPLVLMGAVTHWWGEESGSHGLWMEAPHVLAPAGPAVPAVAWGCPKWLLFAWWHLSGVLSRGAPVVAAALCTQSHV